jgi:hypothetical protein
MDFWEKIQKDIREGLEIVKEGSAVVSQRIEQLTEEGKRKYQVLTLNMKVQDEFSKLGGKIYDLSFRKKNPMTDKRVLSVEGSSCKKEDRKSSEKNESASPEEKSLNRKIKVLLMIRFFEHGITHPPVRCSYGFYHQRPERDCAESDDETIMWLSF